MAAVVESPREVMACECLIYFFIQWCRLAIQQSGFSNYCVVSVVNSAWCSPCRKLSVTDLVPGLYPDDSQDLIPDCAPLIGLRCNRKLSTAP